MTVFTLPPRWLLFLVPLLVVPAGATSAAAQDLTDLVAGSRADSATVAPASWTTIAGEILVGALAAAGTGYLVGLAAEGTCSSCDASEPGGDTPGLVIGVPLGAVAGVWLIGRRDPPPGRLEDTALGALIGAAVFGAYGELLGSGSDVLRWSGALFPAAVAAMGWNRSRMAAVPTVSWRQGPRGPEVMAEWTVVRLSF